MQSGEESENALTREECYVRKRYKNHHVEVDLILICANVEGIDLVSTTRNVKA